MTRASESLSNTRGVNLVEVILVTAISMVVLGGILVVFSAGRNTYFLTEGKLTAREETRKAAQTFVQDLRDARLMSYCLDAAGNTCPGSPGGPGSLAAVLVFREPVLANADLNSFYDGVNINWDAAHDVAYKWVHNAVNPGPLYRCSPSTNNPLTVPPAAGCRVVATRVVNLNFTPINEDGNNTFVPSNVPYDFTAFPTRPTLIEVTITIAPATPAGAPQTPNHTTNYRIILRNPQLP